MDEIYHCLSIFYICDSKYNRCLPTYIIFIYYYLLDAISLFEIFIYYK